MHSERIVMMDAKGIKEWASDETREPSAQKLDQRQNKAILTIKRLCSPPCLVFIVSRCSLYNRYSLRLVGYKSIYTSIGKRIEPHKQEPSGPKSIQSTNIS
jgi:hypothetical protein